MQPNLSLSGKGRFKRFCHGLGASALTLALFASQSGSAFAAITNTATPSGNPASGTLPAPTPSTVNVPVAPAGPQITITSTVIDAPNATTVVDGADTDTIVAGGETITIRYTLTNTGNVTINAVAPTSPSTTFNLVNGTGTFTGYTLVSTSNAASTGAQLLPGESGVWTATYLMSALDTYRAAGIVAATGDALIHTTSATGTPVSGVLNVAVTDDEAETQIPSNPFLTVTKTHTFTTDTGTTGQADVGDVIRYRYEINNTGNVTINGVTVADVHEGAALPAGTVAQETIAAASGGFDGPLAPTLTSTDATANNGTWSVMRPGARIVFFYDHTVTLTEFNNQ